MWTYNYICPSELYHHGIKGQKWGVRRFQYTDGSLTPAGKRRYYVGEGRIDGIKDVVRNLKTMSFKEAAAHTQTVLLGKNKVDTYIKRGTDLSRIQTSKNFEQFAFYSTYKKADVNKYAGLFGNNLQARARKAGEKIPDIYQLKIKNTKKLKIPSDDNIDSTVMDLLKDKSFKDDLRTSIVDSAKIMRRPTQKIVFNNGLRALSKDPRQLTRSDKRNISDALNITLVNHNPEQIRVQDKFYAALKKKGYSALVDVNDKSYSSYHAKKPVIVFDLDSVKLSSVSKLNEKSIKKYNTIYNAERYVKELPYNVKNVPFKYGKMKFNEARDYTDRKMNEYLSR